MNSERIKIFGPILILLAAIAIAALIVMARPEVERAVSVPVQPLVDIATAKKRTVAIPIDVQGSVRASTETQLLADVAGRVNWLSDEFRAGMFVRKGEELARVDDRMYVSAVKRAEAAIAGARSSLAMEKGRAEVALKEWQQRGKDVKRSSAATDLYLRKPQMVEAQARLDAAKADLAQAQADLEHTVVRAPYDAMVKDKSINLGQSLSPGSMMGSVFAVDRAELVVSVPEKQLEFIQLPQTSGSAETHFPRAQLSGTGSLGQQSWVGRLVRTNGVLDPDTRSMGVVIEVADPYGLLGNALHKENPLRIGSYIAAKINGKPMSGIVTLSQAAINPGNKVWVVNAEGRLEQRIVGIRLRDAENAYIDSGLEDGELISLTTLSSFVTGAEVRIASIDGEAPKDQLQLSSGSQNGVQP